MQINPLVSVVMSVYKERIEWLQQSIASILSQSYTDFEFIIICDNPSYREGIDFIKECQEKDKRIILIVNKENKGLTKSLNIGINRARGKYIVRMDADDISLPTRIAQQVKYMESHPQIVASGTGAYKWQNSTLKRLHRRDNSKSLRSMLIFESPIYHPSAIFLKEINGSVVNYDESFKYSQDYALWITLMNSYELSNIDKPLIKYRISESQISTEKHDAQNECALRNQRNAIKMLGLQLNENDLQLLQDITRNPQKEHDIKKVYSFMINFLDSLKNREDIDYTTLASYCLLIYANRVAKSESLIKAFKDLMLLSKRINHLSVYSVLSLISKYL